MKKQTRQMNSTVIREMREAGKKWKPFQNSEHEESQIMMEQNKLLKELTDMMYQMQHVLVGVKGDSRTLQRENHFISKNNYTKENGSPIEIEPNKALAKELAQLHGEKQQFLVQTQVSQDQHNHLHDQLKQALDQMELLKIHKSCHQHLRDEENLSNATESWEVATIGFSPREKDLHQCCYHIVEKTCQHVQDLKKLFSESKNDWLNQMFEMKSILDDIMHLSGVMKLHQVPYLEAGAPSAAKNSMSIVCYETPCKSRKKAYMTISSRVPDSKDLDKALCGKLAMFGIDPCSSQLPDGDYLSAMDRLNHIRKALWFQ